MLYVQTPDNLITVVRELGIVKREQLVKFFSDVETEKQINHYIRTLVGNHLFIEDKAKDTIEWHAAPKVILSEAERRIDAFWIPTSFRSSNVKEFILLPYPFQLLFITHDDDVYDIAVCSQSTTAAVCKKRIQMSLIPGIEDEVNHIMLSRNEEAGRKLGGYGFDSFCVLDNKNNPVYYEWD